MTHLYGVLNYRLLINHFLQFCLVQLFFRLCYNIYFNISPMPECISSLLRVFKNEISILIFRGGWYVPIKFLYFWKLIEDLDPIQESA